MQYKKYLDSWNGSLKENRYSRWIIAGLLLSNIVLVSGLMARNETVVLVPSSLDARESVSINDASSGFKEAWGLQVAMLLGNVTPQTAPYVSSHLGGLASPSVYKTLMSELESQSEKLKKEQITIQFTPVNVFHVADQDLVVVSGQYTVRGARNEAKSDIRTFEIGVDIANYGARIRSLTSYAGAWQPPTPQS
jgi:conjugal transfer pilus assembly protein TraE